jgi:hypothetical protein
VRAPATAHNVDRFGAVVEHGPDLHGVHQRVSFGAFGVAAPGEFLKFYPGLVGDD